MPSTPILGGPLTYISLALVGDGRSLYNELSCEALGEGSCLEAKDFLPKLPLFPSISPGLPTPFPNNKKLAVGQEGGGI